MDRRGSAVDRRRHRAARGHAAEAAEALPGMRYDTEVGLLLSGGVTCARARCSCSDKDYPLFTGDFKPGFVAGLITKVKLSSLLDFSFTPVWMYQSGSTESLEGDPDPPVVDREARRGHQAQRRPRHLHRRRLLVQRRQRRPDLHRRLARRSRSARSSRTPARASRACSPAACTRPSATRSTSTSTSSTRSSRASRWLRYVRDP